MEVVLDDSKSFRIPGLQLYAGYLCTGDEINALGIDWVKLLEKHFFPHGIRDLHTADFLSGEGQYAKLESDFEKRQQVLAEFIDCTIKNVRHIFAVAVDSHALRKVAPKDKMGMNPPGFCLFRILQVIGEHYNEHGYDTPIVVQFDDSQADSPRIYEAWCRVKRLYRSKVSLFTGIMFGSAHVYVPLQAADMIAAGIVRDLRAPLETARFWGPGSPYQRFVKALTFPDDRRVTISTEYWTEESFRSGEPVRGGPVKD